jgi:hypothetical protein
MGWKKEAKMISIGNVYKGPEHQKSQSRKLLNNILNIVYSIKAEYYEGITPEANVVFFVPGSLGTPSWTGLRDGTFSRKKKLLMIQVAVPKELVDSPKLEAFALDSLRKANELALRVYHKKGFEYPLTQANELVDKVEQRLKEKKGSA